MQKNRKFLISIFISLLIHSCIIFFVPIRQMVRPIKYVEVSLVSVSGENAALLERRDYLQSPPKQISSTPISRERELESRTGEPLVLPAEKKDVGLEEKEGISEIEKKEIVSPLLPTKKEPSFPKLGETKEIIEDEESQIFGPVAQRGIIRKIYPSYPQEAEEKNIEGEVEIKFWVSPQGLVTRTEIINTSGYLLLDNTAVNSLKQWLFEPLSEGSQFQEQWGTITIKFKLK